VLSEAIVAVESEAICAVVSDEMIELMDSDSSCRRSAKEPPGFRARPL
jgi:hypothetical protein